jgi:SAM-dependent MidA family methyltransferase
MKDINIRVNKARILSYSVELNEDKPEVSATIGLFANDKKISSFSLRTQSYYSESMQFEIPLKMINVIKKIAEQLEEILVVECNKNLPQLESGMYE